MRPDWAPLLAFPASLIAVELMFLLRFQAVLARWLDVMRRSASLMADRTLGDDEKQARMAKASFSTLAGTLGLGIILIASLGGFVVALGAGLALSRMDISLPDVVMRRDFEIASVLIAIGYYWVRRRVLG
ncbi:MAG: hypothetical protein ACE5DK_01030 [Paracoccaceae bacterium]